MVLIWTMYVAGILLRLVVGSSMCLTYFKLTNHPMDMSAMRNLAFCVQHVPGTSTSIVSAAPPILLDNLKRLSTPVIFFLRGRGVKKQKRDKLQLALNTLPGTTSTAHAFAREEKHIKSEPGAFTRDEPASSLPKEDECNERRAGASKSSRTFAFLVFFPSAEKKNVSTMDNGAAFVIFCLSFIFYFTIFQPQPKS